MSLAEVAVHAGERQLAEVVVQAGERAAGQGMTKALQLGNMMKNHGEGSSDGPAAERAAAKELSKEAQRGIRSLEKQIAQHEKKLADFKANPRVRPGMEGQPKEVIEAAQQLRIRHL